MTVPKKVFELIERFDRSLKAYRSGQYKETPLRLEFIDPLFKALGWDMDNEKGAPEAYKDVIHEDAIKVGGITKAPDYCFRIGGTRKFFLEAKKPSVDIRGDAHPAFQLRRYAWSAKLPLSILTDFEEFAIYDCRIEPIKTDKASTARILYFKYTEYLDRWDEIAAIFSREAADKGLFDKYAESTKAKRGTAEVDDAFLKEIESWRDMLARNIALRNPELTQHELNFSVQRTIDRIIFLRICEDRGIEVYGRLMGCLNGTQVYKRICQLFRKADDRYNSGLFHFRREKGRTGLPDDLTLSLNIDDKPLKDIIRNLYYPDSPYEFSVFSANILGQVYEQFLGKVIRLTSGHRAVVEDKPEVKKAGGVYYTPTYIVDYIVKNTVGKLLEGKKPGPRGGVSKLKILDPACGSGSFLIGAYQYLLDWHRDQYVADGPEKHRKVLYQGSGSDWRLTTAERKCILLNNIYGVDIDPQAVEVTKLSLLLKVLEGESEQTLSTQLRLFHERALPDLGDNIKCGNSLIGPDFYNKQMSLLNDEEHYRINVFNWEAEFPEIVKAGGFDAVIGNPPYDVLEKERGASSWPHTALSEYVKIRDDYRTALGGKLNLFRFFIIQSLKLTRNGGWFGMIVPMALLADISCTQTRKQLILSTSELLFDCFPQKDNPNRRVFLSAKLSTIIITSRKSDATAEVNAKFTVRVYPWNNFDDPFRECKIHFKDIVLLDPDTLPIPLVNKKQWKLCLKLHSTAGIMRLGDVKDFIVRRGEINQTIYRNFITDKSKMARLLKGVEVGQFHIRGRLSQGYREWFDENEFMRVGKPKQVVYEQRIAIQRITGVDEQLRIVATRIDPPTYFADSTNSISLQPESKYQLEYLLGLLNSRLFQWRFKLTSTNNNVGVNELNIMPFCTINFSDNSDKALHNRMVELVEQMLELHMQLAVVKISDHKTRLQRQIDATDRQIDDLVYKLYGIKEDERKIIEGMG